MQFEIQFGSPVTETGLVDGITLVTERVIDGDGLFDAL